MRRSAGAMLTLSILRNLLIVLGFAAVLVVVVVSREPNYGVPSYSGQSPLEVTR